MKNLLSLMEEFSILGMDQAPLSSMMAPQAAVAPEEEYELDAEGNPILDAEGNPVKKIAADPLGMAPMAPGAVAPAGAAPACKCDHADGDLAAAAPAGMAPPAPNAMVPQLPPEDEFTFKI